MRKVHKQSGITLLELLIAVAVLGILASLAIGGLHSMGSKMRLNSAVQALRGDMEKAKLTAVNRNIPSLMSFNSSTSPGSYRICLDQDGDDTCGSGDEVVLQQDFGDYLDVTLNSVNFSGSKRILFNSRGLPESVSGGFGAGTVNCTNSKGESLSVVLARTGRIRVQ